jgi:hypothetical protein
MASATVERRASVLFHAIEEQVGILFDEQRATLEAMRSKQLQRIEKATATASFNEQEVARLSKQLTDATHRAGLARRNADDARQKMISIEMALEAVNSAVSMGQQFLEMAAVAIQPPLATAKPPA